MSEGSWRIVLAEQTMKLGQVDNILFGRDTCHSFLALQNPEGEIVSEIHGSTYHPESNRVSYKGQSPQTYMKAFASSLGAADAFTRATKAIKLDDKWPRLKAVVTDGEWRFDQVPEDQTQVILEGSKEKVMGEWLDACKIGKEFNELDLYYIPICARTHGRNCNSVTGMMMHAMNVDFPEDKFHLEARGFANKLVAKYTSLRSFDTHGVYDPDELDAQLRAAIDAEDNYFHLVTPVEDDIPEVPVIIASETDMVERVHETG